MPRTPADIRVAKWADGAHRIGPSASRAAIACAVPSLFILAAILMSVSTPVISRTARAEDREPVGDSTDEPSSNRFTVIDENGVEETYESVAPGSKMYRVVSKRKLSRAELEELSPGHPFNVKRARTQRIAFAAIFGIMIASGVYYAKYLHDKHAVIRETEKNGGTLEDIRSRIGLFNREWDVTYTDANGKHCEGTCHVQNGWGGSVYWKISDPADGEKIAVRDAGFCECIECGAEMPPGKTTCPGCGWTYLEAAD